MDNTPKTISFRTDEITSQKMEKIKEIVFEGRDVSNALILRTAVDFLHDNYGNNPLGSEDNLELMKGYVKATAFRYSIIDFEKLDEFLYELEEAFHEYDVEEVQELACLYNEEDPITVAQLIRFKHKNLPLTFLRIMGEDETELKNLSDDEIANLILKKISGDNFKKKAKKLFNIDC